MGYHKEEGNVRGLTPEVVQRNSIWVLYQEVYSFPSRSNAAGFWTHRKATLSVCTVAFPGCYSAGWRELAKVATEGLSFAWVVTVTEKARDWLQSLAASTVHTGLPFHFSNLTLCLSPFRLIPCPSHASPLPLFTLIPFLLLFLLPVFLTLFHPECFPKSAKCLCTSHNNQEKLQN